MSAFEYKEYSVLMSVYHKERSEYLKQAIESIQVQSLSTNDFVLVCDGPLNDELDAVIQTKQLEMGENLNVVRLAKNGGLGNALNEGIKPCKNELVARMDSDDIAYPDRCEKQIAVFNTHSEVSICSGIVEEFTTDPNTADTRRVPPETNAEIIEFAKKRNPFNHPCVLLNDSVVQNGSTVGNGVLLNPGVEVHHDCSVDDFALIYTNSVVRTYAKVGKRVRIGSNCTICNNATVSDGADIPDCTAVH